MKTIQATIARDARTLNQYTAVRIDDGGIFVARLHASDAVEGNTVTLLDQHGPGERIGTVTKVARPVTGDILVTLEIQTAPKQPSMSQPTTEPTPNIARLTASGSTKQTSWVTSKAT